MLLQRSKIRLKCLALVSGAALAGCLPTAAQNVTPTPETGVTPSTLLLYRADLISGKETAYEQTESQIVRAYADAKIPIYWSALEAVTGSPHVLYFDGFDNFADIEKSGTDLAQGLDAHPEIGGLQQQLADLVASTRTVLAFRRDDLGYRLNKIDLAKGNYVRVSIFQFRAGYEEEFAEAVRTRARMYETNDIDTPWMFYQVHSGYSLPAYIEFQAMNSLSEIDDALERNAKIKRPGGASPLTAQKWIRDADLSIDIQIYRMSQSMSHLSAAEAAAASGAKGHSASAARTGKYTLPARPRIEFPGIPEKKRREAMQRKGSAVWQGGLKDGKGTISTDSGVLKQTQYSFSTRFENGVGTNPEELLAAAHAGCFAMALSAQLGNAGMTATKLESTATISLEKLPDGFAITKSHLDLIAHVPGADKAKFDTAVKNAETGCPVSKLFKAEISVSAKLVS